MKQSYVYAFVDLTSPGQYSYDGINCSFLYKPWYIGKGIHNRYKHHFYDHSGSYKSRKMLKLLQYNSLDEMVIFLQKNISSIDAEDLEIKTIASIGRYKHENGPLTNILPGGEGMSSEYMIEHNPMNNISTEQHSKTVKDKQWSGEKGMLRKQEFSRRFSGSNNPQAKKYIILYPNGNLEIINGLKTWCKNNEVSWSMIRNWINRGKIRKNGFKDNSIFIASKRKILGWNIMELNTLNFKGIK